MSAPTRPARTAPTRPPSTTHATTDDLVVFHIGMTVRAPWRPDLWGPVAAAMPRMIAELTRARDAHRRGEREDDLGFLHAEFLLGAKGPWVVQYWRSTEHLYAYARSAEGTHLPAWKAFNTAARSHPGAVGIWHETYTVPAENVETFYGNGAELGLARAVGSAPLGARGRTARQRLGTR